FLISGFSRFFMPARSGMMQVIVSGKDQSQAASIGQATFALAFVIGPAIASPLYFVVGPTIAVLINSVSFLVSALCVQAIRALREALHPYVFAQGERTTSGLGAVMHELVAG